MANCKQSHSQGLAIKSDKGVFLYDKEAVEMHALTALILSIAGLDAGSQYATFSKQLCEMHKVANEDWGVVWKRFVDHSTFDDDKVIVASELKKRWSSQMSRDGQIIHATFFSKMVPYDVYKAIMGGPKPRLTNKEWPTLADAPCELRRRIGYAEQRCAGSPLPTRGVRWSPLMALLHGKLSPITYLMLIGDGMECSMRRANRNFEQISMRSINTAQAEDPLVCIVCEGVANLADQAKGKSQNAQGEWLYCVHAKCKLDENSSSRRSVRAMNYTRSCRIQGHGLS